MKKNLMQTSIIAIAFIIVLSGCGGAGKPKSCDCEKLDYLEEKYFLEGDSKPYTGDCYTKDKFDSIVEMRSYENGFRIHLTERLRILGNYPTTTDMTYDIEGKELNGYRLTYNNAVLSSEDEMYVASAIEFKDGKTISSWQIGIYHSDWSTGPRFSVKIDSENDQTPPNCIPGATYDPSHSIDNREGGTGLLTGTSTQFSGKWETEIAMSNKEDFSEVDKVIECLKKEYPRFNYFRK
jgi:hypothetical protein